MKKSNATLFGIAALAGLVVWLKKKQPISGIGDVPVWNKGHIRNWLAYEHYGYPEKIVVYRDRPYYVNEGCVEVESYTDRDSRYYYRNFSIREKDIDYLRMLCQEYRVEFIEL